MCIRDSLASVVNGPAAGGHGYDGPGECAEVLHTGFPGPLEGVNDAIFRRDRSPGNFTQVIDTGSNVIRASQVAEVSGRTISFPEHSMRPSRVHRRQRGVRAQTRRADGLAVVVDAEAECDGVAAVRMEFMDLAIWFPDHGFKTENLVGRAGCAGWIRNAILRKPDDLALIVEIKSAGVFAALRVLAALQVGKRLQGRCV